MGRIIDIIIRTPQFLGCQEKYDWTEQSGYFDTDINLFTPDYIYHNGRVGPHKVQFINRSQWKKYRLNASLMEEFPFWKRLYIAFFYRKKMMQNWLLLMITRYKN